MGARRSGGAGHPPDGGRTDRLPARSDPAQDDERPRRHRRHPRHRAALRPVLRPGRRRQVRSGLRGSQGALADRSVRCDGGRSEEAGLSRLQEYRPGAAGEDDRRLRARRADLGGGPQARRSGRNAEDPAYGRHHAVAGRLRRRDRRQVRGFRCVWIPGAYANTVPSQRQGRRGGTPILRMALYRGAARPRRRPGSVQGRGRRPGSFPVEVR